MSPTVRYFFSAQSILPALSGTAAALQTIFRTTLVTGAGTANVQTLTVSGGVATAGLAAAHGYIVGNAVLMAGADVVDLNGVAQVTSVPTPNSFTFDTVAADGAAAGSITCKLAPAGWAETYTSGSVSVFDPTAVDALGMSLRMDDADTKNARVVGYESMSSIDTGDGPIPTAAQLAGGLYWPKSYQINSTARPWIVIADGRGVFYACAPSIGGKHTLMYAGDIESDKAGDAWGWMISGNQSDQTNASSVPEGCVGAGGRGVRAGAYIARPLGGTGGSTALKRIGESQNGDSAGTVYSGSSSYSASGDGPNAANNALLLTPLELIENGIRGRVPGVYHARQGLGVRYATGQTFLGEGVLAGRMLVAIQVGYPIQASSGGVVFVDITGPWSR